MKHTVSLSGGRTSTGVLTKAVIDKYGKDNVDVIFCDTGAEDRETYRFIRDCEQDYGIKITCLKLIMPLEHGKGCEYLVCTTKEITDDYYAWRQLTAKYGNPYMPGGKFCTNEMKTQIYKKYCSDKYGKGNFYTWLGYRFEEGNRIWGKLASNTLGKLGLTNREKTEFYLECLQGNTETILDEYYPSMFPSADDEKEKEKIRKALLRINERAFRFMPEISTFTKNDVIAYMSDKSFDLNIGEHLMNCIFCIEKPLGTLLLAIKDRPLEARRFLDIVKSSDVAIKPSRKEPKEVMYRDGLTFEWLYNKAMNTSRADILKMSRLGEKLAKKNPCSSGECSPFSADDEQLDLVI